MIDTPRIARTEAQSTAVMRLTIPRTEIRTTMGPGIKELMAAVSAHGITPAGPRTPAGDLLERYIVGPESGPDPSVWRTELTRPLAD